MKKHNTFIFLYIIINYNLFGQVCGTDQLRFALISKDSNYLEYEKKQNERIHRDITNKQSKNARFYSYECTVEGVVTLPVVFHIIHQGEEIGIGTNVSDEWIKNQLTKLNERFRRKKGDDGNPIAVGADMEIEFAMAIRDPMGNETNGIIRHYDSTKTKYDFKDSKTWFYLESKNWSAEKYINIYIVDLLNATGFSFQPGDGRIEYDFIAITNNSSGTVLTHEMGHFFGLHHTFHNNYGPLGICPTNSDCLKEGDYICDTPPINSLSGCNLNDECSPGSDISNSVNNYMSYCLVRSNRFTQGQKERVRSFLTSDWRWKLINSEALMPTNLQLEASISTDIERFTNYPIICNYLNPEILVKNLGSVEINKIKIGSYINGILQNTVTKNVTIKSNTELKLKLDLLIFTTNGENVVSFKIEQLNEKSTDSYPINNIVCRTVFVHLKNNTNNFIVDFEEGKDYVLINKSLRPIEIVNVNNCDERVNKAISFPAFNPNSPWYGGSFTIPSFDLDSVYSAHLVFDRSYKEYKTNSSPSLFVYFHEGCEITENSKYTTLFAYYGDIYPEAPHLKTVNGRDSINIWFPNNCDDWKKDSINITHLRNKKNLKVKFSFGTYNNYGTQNLYLDNISINRKYQIKINSKNNYGIVKFKTGNGVYSEGERIIIEAFELNNSCYKFKNWTENGKIISIEPTTEIIANSNRNIFANFELKKYNLELSKNIEIAGTISNSGIFSCDTILTIKAIPNSGFRFKYWTDESNEIVSNDSEYTFKILKSDKLRANFEIVLSNELDIIESLQIFPNPINNTLNIEYKSGNIKKTEITIFDISGNIMWNNKLFQTEKILLKIDFSNFPSGEYIFFIENQTLRKSVKIVKE